MSLKRHCLALLVFLALAGAAYAQKHDDYFEAEDHRHGIKTLKPPPPPAHPEKTGMWTTLSVFMPINPVHMALMNNGKVLVIAGSGNYPNDTKKRYAGVFDPVDETIRTFTLQYDMFCNGMVILPDGRPFIMGGTKKYPPVWWQGLPDTSVFSPSSGTFTKMATMSGGRWYPTGTVLSDGTVMVISGLGEEGGINQTVQIYNAATDQWTAAGTGYPGMTLYPRQTLLPSGHVFSPAPTSQFYDPKTHVWTAGPKTKYGLTRNYGTAVLLPLTPSNQFTPTVMILGGGTFLKGGTRITATTETVDLSVKTPKWKWGPSMHKPRIDLNATILPNGQVLVSGGSSVGEDAPSAVLGSEIYDPVAKTLKRAASMEFPRLYHSNTLLLPDGRVLAAGSNPQRGTYEPHIEVYSPAYLFNSDGTPATRPVITSVSSPLSYGGSFQITTPDPASIRSVVLIRPGAPTHAFDMEQRLVELDFTAGNGVLNATAPATSSLAPPGYYLLFIVNRAGVPSVAQFVLLPVQ